MFHKYFTKAAVALQRNCAAYFNWTPSSKNGHAKYTTSSSAVAYELAPRAALTQTAKF